MVCFRRILRPPRDEVEDWMVVGFGLLWLGWSVWLLFGGEWVEIWVVCWLIRLQVFVGVEAVLVWMGRMLLHLL